MTAMVLALSAMAGCFIGVSSAAAGVINTILVGKAPYAVSSDKTHVWALGPDASPTRLKTPGPVSCSALTGGGEPATGVVKFKWVPKSKPATATGTLTMPLVAASTTPLETSEVTTGPAFEFSGELTTGAHAPLAFSGTALTRYIGAASCGHKGVNVKTVEISHSEVGFP
ncbi:MAG TPA: hypothetical protein VHT25_01415 [Solirubrobacteraceae bacterium]|nr:hypothetical protein [Solirubrobacteraceae bacterium]